MFYGVYYYNIEEFGPANVYIAGFYQDFISAQNRLDEVIPFFKRSYKNSVTNHNRIGWINKYEFGDMMHNGLTACQPHSSVDVFTDANNKAAM